MAVPQCTSHGHCSRGKFCGTDYVCRYLSSCTPSTSIDGVCKPRKTDSPALRRNVLMVQASKARNAAMQREQEQQRKQEQHKARIAQLTKLYHDPMRKHGAEAHFYNALPFDQMSKRFRDCMEWLRKNSRRTNLSDEEQKHERACRVMQTLASAGRLKGIKQKLPQEKRHGIERQGAHSPTDPLQTAESALAFHADQQQHLQAARRGVPKIAVTDYDDDEEEFGGSKKTRRRRTNRSKRRVRTRKPRRRKRTTHKRRKSRKRR